jgi:hypothetical protein
MESEAKEGVLVVSGEAADATQFKNRAEKKLATAKSFVIETVEQRDEVLDWVRGIKKDKADLDALCDPAIAAAHAEHKARINVKNQYAIPLNEAEEVAKTKLAAFKRKHDAELEAARVKAEKEAAEKAEADRKERQRIADEAAEVERVAREKREKEEKARRLAAEIESGHLSAIAEDEQRTIKKAADAAAKAGNEKLAAEAAAEAVRLANENAEREKREKTEREAREKAEREAQAAKDEEARKERERVAAEAEAAAELERIKKKKEEEKAAEATKAKGSSFTVVWTATVDSDEKLLELAKAVVAGVVPIKALAPGQEWLDKYAKDVEGAVPLPGVTYHSKDKVSIRR